MIAIQIHTIIHLPIPQCLIKLFKRVQSLQTNVFCFCVNANTTNL